MPILLSEISNLKRLYPIQFQIHDTGKLKPMDAIKDEHLLGSRVVKRDWWQSTDNLWGNETVLKHAVITDMSLNVSTKS